MADEKIKMSPLAAWAAANPMVMVALISASIILALVVGFCTAYKIIKRRQARELEALKKSCTQRTTQTTCAKSSLTRLNTTVPAGEEVTEMSAGELERALHEREMALEEAEERSRLAEAEVQRLRERPEATRTVWKCRAVATSREEPSEPSAAVAEDPQAERGLGSDSGLVLDGCSCEYGGGGGSRRSQVPTQAHLAKRYRGKHQCSGLAVAEDAEYAVDAVCTPCYSSASDLQTLAQTLR